MTTSGKVAIITGAGSGIGKRTALLLLAEGYSVALAGRRLDRLEEAAAESGAGERALVVQTDVTDPAAVDNMFHLTIDPSARLYHLLNNPARGAPRADFDEISYEDWKSVVDVNLTGVFLCSQRAFRIMKNQTPQGGRIINNGSISAHTPRPNSAPYTSTKHAITGLTKSTSLDGRAYNICCGQIDIGNAATEMTARMRSGIPQANGSIMVEPNMDSDGVAQTILYMDSLPLDTNVLTLTVMANQMPYVGRG